VLLEGTYQDVGRRVEIVFVGGKRRV
jgi:hypothetical protein